MTLHKRYLTFIAILVGAFILFSMKSCHDHSVELANLIKAGADKDEALTRYKNKYDQVVTSANLSAINSKEAIQSFASKNKELTDLLSRFKDVKQAIVVKQVFQVDTFTVPFEVRIPCIDSIKFVKKDSSINIFGYIFPNDLRFDSIIVKNTLNIVTGEKKMGLFHANRQTIDIVNTNKYMKVFAIKDYDVTPVKKFYQTRLFSALVGLVGGYFLFRP